MDKDGVILRSMEIQHRLQHLILHLDELHGLFDTLLILAHHNGHHVPHKADVAVDDQAVVGAGFGELRGIQNFLAWKKAKQEGAE